MSTVSKIVDKVQAMKENHNPSNGEESEPLPEWSHARDFTDKESGICVRINKREMKPRFTGAIPVTQFSMEFCRVREDGKPTRFFPILCTTEGTSSPVNVSIEPFNMMALQTLVNDAEAWALSERREREKMVAQRRLHSKVNPK